MDPNSIRAVNVADVRKKSKATSIWQRSMTELVTHLICGTTFALGDVEPFSNIVKDITKFKVAEI